MNVVKNKIRNYQKTAQKDLLRLISLDSDMALQIPANENVGDILEQKEAAEAVVQTIKSTLSAQEIYILKRMIYEKASHKELASELGTSIWASQKRLERIRDKLSKDLPGRRKKKKINFEKYVRLKNLRTYYKGRH